MSDLTETYKALREHSREKKLNNKEFSTKLLDELGVDYESFNNGIHLRVLNDNEVIDFYPSTGTYKIGNSYKRRGVMNMLKYMGIK